MTDTIPEWAMHEQGRVLHKMRADNSGRNATALALAAVAAKVERETLERCIVAMRTSRNGITMRSMKIAALPRKYQEPSQ